MDKEKERNRKTLERDKRGLDRLTELGYIQLGYEIE